MPAITTRDHRGRTHDRLLGSRVPAPYAAIGCGSLSPIAVVEVHRHRPCEHQSLDVASHALEVLGALAMVDAHDVLFDDRSVGELLGT